MDAFGDRENPQKFRLGLSENHVICQERSSDQSCDISLQVSGDPDESTYVVRAGTQAFMLTAMHHLADLQEINADGNIATLDDPATSCRESRMQCLSNAEAGRRSQYGIPGQIAALIDHCEMKNTMYIMLSDGWKMFVSCLLALKLSPSLDTLISEQSSSRSLSHGS